MKQWFRLYTEILDDPKVQKLASDVFKGWINILCLASRNNGVIPPIEEVSFALRISKSAAETLMKALENKGLIDDSMPHNWQSRQFQSDVSTDRVKRHRERFGNVSCNVSETPRARTEQNRPDTDTEVHTRQPQTQPPADAGSSADADGTVKQKKTRAKKPIDPAADPLADYPDLAAFFPRLVDLFTQLHPNSKCLPKPNTAEWMAWRSTLAMMAENDRYKADDLIDCFNWIFTEYEPTSDKFSWLDQIYSLPALRVRSSKNKPSKFERIFDEWKRSTELSPASYTNSRRESSINAAQAAGQVIPGLRPADFPAGRAPTAAEMAEEDLPF